MDMDAIITEILKGSQDREFRKIEKYAERTEKTIKTITDTLHSGPWAADELRLEAYNHRLGAKLLKVILVDEGNVDATSRAVNDFFAILSDENYTGKLTNDPKF